MTDSDVNGPARKPDPLTAFPQPPVQAEALPVEQAIMLREQAPELYDLWLKIAQEKAATANYVDRAPYEVPERLAQRARPRVLGALIVVLSFCGYLAWLGGPGPYIGGLIAILDLAAMLGIFFGLRPDRINEPRRPGRKPLPRPKPLPPPRHGRKPGPRPIAPPGSVLEEVRTESQIVETLLEPCRKLLTIVGNLPLSGRPNRGSTRMATGQTDRVEGGTEPELAPLPSALRMAARRPPEEGSTLVLDAGGQNVVVVLGKEGGDARLMWAFIQRQLSGRKTVRM